MPRLVKDFPATEPGSTGTYSVDFTADLPAGVRLTAASWTLGLHQVYPGAVPDPLPPSRLIGNPAVQGAVSLQRIGGLIAGNDYLVTVTGAASDGEVVILWTVLPCRAPQ